MDFSFIILRIPQVICFVVQSVQNLLRAWKVFLEYLGLTYRITELLRMDVGKDLSMMLEMIFVTEGEIRTVDIRKFLVLECGV